MPKGVPNKIYSGQFKVKVVDTMYAEHLSCPEEARRFSIQSETQVARWESIYAAHLYCGRPELEGLLASLLHYGIHTFGAKDGNWIEPGGRRWMVLPGYDEEVWNG